MAAALAYRCDGSPGQIVFETQPGAYNDERLIAFLDKVHAELTAKPVTLLWDGLPSHRSKKMQAYLADQAAWLSVERLPAYAPELNPVEGLWGNVKGAELANLCPDTLDEVMGMATTAIERVRSAPALALAFLDHCGLSF